MSEAPPYDHRSRLPMGNFQQRKLEGEELPRPQSIDQAMHSRRMETDDSPKFYELGPHPRPQEMTGQYSLRDPRAGYEGHLLDRDDHAGAYELHEMRNPIKRIWPEGGREESATEDELLEYVKKETEELRMMWGASQETIDAHWGYTIQFDPVQKELGRVTADIMAGKTKADKTIVDAVTAGLQRNAVTMWARGKMPDPEIQPTHEDPAYLAIASEAVWLASSMPTFVIGGAIGNVMVPPLSPLAPITAPLAGFAGAFAFETALRESVADSIVNGQYESFEDYLERFSSIAWKVAKSATIGGATAGTAKWAHPRLVAPLVQAGEAFGRPLAGAAGALAFRGAGETAKVLSEMTTMTVAGSILEQHMPNARDFANVTLAILTVKAAGPPSRRIADAWWSAESTFAQRQLLESRIMWVFRKGGQTPQEVLEATLSDPGLRDLMLDPTLSNEQIFGDLRSAARELAILKALDERSPDAARDYSSLRDLNESLEVLDALERAREWDATTEEQTQAFLLLSAPTAENPKGQNRLAEWDHEGGVVKPEVLDRLITEEQAFLRELDRPDLLKVPEVAEEAAAEARPAESAKVLPKGEPRFSQEGIEGLKFGDQEAAPDIWGNVKTGEGVELDVHRGSGREEASSAYAPGAEGPALGDGRYSALESSAAEKFGPNVETLTVRLENPYVLESDGQIKTLAGMGRGDPLPKEVSDWVPILKKVRSAIEAKGHDGVIVNVRHYRDFDESAGIDSVKRLREVFGDSQVVEFAKKEPSPSTPRPAEADPAMPTAEEAALAAMRPAPSEAAPKRATAEELAAVREQILKMEEDAGFAGLGEAEAQRVADEAFSRRPDFEEMLEQEQQRPEAERELAETDPAVLREKEREQYITDVEEAKGRDSDPQVLGPEYERLLDYDQAEGIKGKIAHYEARFPLLFSMHAPGGAFKKFRPDGRPTAFAQSLDSLGLVRITERLDRETGNTIYKVENPKGGLLAQIAKETRYKLLVDNRPPGPGVPKSAAKEQARAERQLQGEIDNYDGTEVYREHDLTPDSDALIQHIDAEVLAKLNNRPPPLPLVKLEHLATSDTVSGARAVDLDQLSRHLDGLEPDWRDLPTEDVVRRLMGEDAEAEGFPEMPSPAEAASKAYVEETIRDAQPISEAGAENIREANSPENIHPARVREFDESLPQQQYPVEAPSGSIAEAVETKTPWPDLTEAALSLAPNVQRPGHPDRAPGKFDTQTYEALEDRVREYVETGDPSAAEVLTWYQAAWDGAVAHWVARVDVLRAAGWDIGDTQVAPGGWHVGLMKEPAPGRYNERQLEVMRGIRDELGVFLTSLEAGEVPLELSSLHEGGRGKEFRLERDEWNSRAEDFEAPGLVDNFDPADMWLPLDMPDAMTRIGEWVDPWFLQLAETGLELSGRLEGGAERSGPAAVGPYREILQSLAQHIDRVADVAPVVAAAAEASGVAPVPGRRKILVSCTGPKCHVAKGGAVAAEDLYTGAAVKDAKAAATTAGAEIGVILSAKHGVLDPKEQVEPYDQRLPKDESKALELVSGEEQLQKFVELVSRDGIPEEVYLHGIKTYRLLFSNLIERAKVAGLLPESMRVVEPVRTQKGPGAPGVGDQKGSLSAWAKAAREAPAAEREAPAAEPAQGPAIAVGFAGGGTMEAALGWIRNKAGLAPHRVTHAAEKDPKIVAEYNRAHGTDFKPEDVLEVGPEQIQGADLYHVSPECKSLSLANIKRKVLPNDIAVAKKIASNITEALPERFVLENVPEFLEKPELIDPITTALDRAGYTWDVQVHNAADYGAPMTRNRMVLRAERLFRGQEPGRVDEVIPVPPKREPGDWWEVVKDLVEDAPDAPLGKRGASVENWELERIMGMIERGSLDPNKPIITSGGSTDVARAYARNAGGPAPTLKATTKEKPRILIPDGEGGFRPKQLTARMMARLMGLPDEFQVPEPGPRGGLGTAKKIIGNGIHAVTTEAFIEPLLRVGKKGLAPPPPTAAEPAVLPEKISTLKDRNDAWDALESRGQEGSPENILRELEARKFTGGEGFDLAKEDALATAEIDRITQEEAQRMIDTDQAAVDAAAGKPVDVMDRASGWLPGFGTPRPPREPAAPPPPPGGGPPEPPPGGGPPEPPGGGPRRGLQYEEFLARHMVEGIRFGPGRLSFEESMKWLGQSWQLQYRGFLNSHDPGVRLLNRMLRRKLQIGETLPPVEPEPLPGEPRLPSLPVPEGAFPEAVRPDEPFLKRTWANIKTRRKMFLIREGLDVGDNFDAQTTLLAGVKGRSEYFLERKALRFEDLAPIAEGFRDIMLDVGSGERRLRNFKIYLMAHRIVELSERVDPATGKTTVTEDLVDPATEAVIGEIERQYIRTTIKPEFAKEWVRLFEPEFESLRLRLWEYQKNVLTYLKDGGILSEKDYRTMLRTNKSYMPTYRVLVSGELGTPGLSGSFSVRNPIHALVGNDQLRYVDPIESIIKNTYAQIALAERNRMLLTLREWMIDQQMGGELLPERVTKFKLDKTDLNKIKRQVNRMSEELDEPYMAQDGAEGPGGPIAVWDKGVAEAIIDGVPIFRHVRRDLGANEIQMFVDGKREVWRVEPLIAEMLTSTDASQIGMLVKLLSTPARLLRAGAVLDPGFIARNPFRDIAGAVVYSQHPVELTKEVMRLVRNVGSGEGRDRIREIHDRWWRSGGPQAELISIDRYMAKDVDQIIKSGKIYQGSWNVVSGGMDLLQRAGQMSELLTRLAEFEVVTRAAESRGVEGRELLEQGGLASRNVSLDYAKHGSYMMNYNRLNAFFNARLRGIEKMVRETVRDPLGFQMRALATISVPMISLWALNKDIPGYTQIPDWQKDMFWLIPIPLAWSKDVDTSGLAGFVFERRGDYLWARLPGPFTMMLIYGAAIRRTLDALWSEDPEAFEGFGQTLLDDAVGTLMPTMAAPAWMAHTGRNPVSKAPIAPADREGMEQQYQYYPWTSSLTKSLAATVAQVQILKDTKAANPAYIDQWMQAWTAGLGTTAWDLSSRLLEETGVLDKRPMPMTFMDIPLVKSFFVRWPVASARSVLTFGRLYREMEENPKTFQKLWSDGEHDAAVDYMLSNGLGMTPPSHIRDAMSQVRLIIRNIANSGVPAEEKLHLIDQHTWLLIDFASEGVRIMRALKQVDALSRPGAAKDDEEMFRYNPPSTAVGPGVRRMDIQTGKTYWDPTYTPPEVAEGGSDIQTMRIPR